MTPPIEKARVILFKPDGKYYTEEPWEIPADAIGPYDMDRSPQFRRISGGHVLIDTQEPWGYPHLFPAEPAQSDVKGALERVSGILGDVESDDVGGATAELIHDLRAALSVPGLTVDTTTPHHEFVQGATAGTGRCWFDYGDHRACRLDLDHPIHRKD